MSFAGPKAASSSLRVGDQVANRAMAMGIDLGLGLIPGVRDVRGKIRFDYLLEALGDRSRPGMLDELLVDELSVS
ncbi:MAG: hypothetical protein AABY22_00005, partial [Nanoarchaeota archaeon]